jgi:hypothetical protein
MTDVKPLDSSVQNSWLPQLLQNPRLAKADDWYHVMLARSEISSSAVGTWVAAT